VSSLTALVLATPLFGLALSPPTAAAPPASWALAPAVDMASVVTSAHAAVPDPAEAARADQASGANDDFAEQMRRRQELAKVHKWLGIATWTAMTATVVLGTIQFHNVYGFGRGRDDTPCVQGEAIFGQQQCSGRAWPHFASALATTALYGATFGVSTVMPDPLEIAEQDTPRGRKLRTHKTLRWVHLSGMIGQVLLGIVIGSGQRFGLDRANNFGALKALGAVHMVAGIATYGALTWSGALMLF
jgi:hypothetical protein